MISEQFRSWVVGSQDKLDKLSSLELFASHIDFDFLYFF